MFRKLSTVALLLVSAGVLASSQAQTTSSPEAARTRELTGDMVLVLTQFARTCKVPMLIELAEPVEQDVSESLLSCDVGHFLTDVVTKHSHYSFGVRGRSVHFYERTVVAEKSDFLNWKFQSFVLPANVAEFKNVLTARLGSRGTGTFGGGLVHGLLPTDLLKRPLPKKRYVNSSARDILLDVQDIDGSFYNLIIFPKQRDLDDSDIQKAFTSWQWRSVIPETVNN